MSVNISMKTFIVKKKTLCRILCAAAAMLINMYLIYYFLAVPQVNSLAVRLDYEAMTANNIQVFYSAEPEPAFSEENSVVFEYSQAGETLELYVTVPVELTYLRIDFGEKNGVSVLKSFALCINNETVNMELPSVPMLTNQVDNVRSEDGALVITAADGDPYIVFSADNLGISNGMSHYSSRQKIMNIFMALFLCIAVDLTAAAIIRYLDEIIGLPLKIYRDRKMFAELVKNDFQARFAGSYFGIFWAFVQPLITMTLYWFVFQVGLRAGNVSDYPFILFLMSGMIPWLYFSEALSSSTNSLTEYSYLVKKVVFNVEIIPALKTASALFVHVAFVALLAVICTAYGYFPSLYWLQLLYYIPCTAFLALGLSYITASCTAFFKDTVQIVNILLTIGVWLTPVMWNPVGTIPEALHAVFKLNPIYYIVDGFRDCFLAKVWFWEKPVWTTGFWLISVSVYIIGVKLFNKLKVHFADVL